MEAAVNSSQSGLLYIMALSAALFSSGALAQYQWKDDNGRDVYSDRPPPSSISAKQIVRMPSAGMRKLAVSDRADTKSDAKPDAVKLPATAMATPQKSMADKEMEARGKKLDQQDIDKKRKETEAQAERTAQACTEARAAQKTLESGERIATTNTKGEREIMGDAERAKKLEALKRDFGEACKAKS
jgi:Domain of unknown function (DUF4124)